MGNKPNSIGKSEPSKLGFAPFTNINEKWKESESKAGQNLKVPSHPCHQRVLTLASRILPSSSSSSSSSFSYRPFKLYSGFSHSDRSFKVYTWYEPLDLLIFYCYDYFNLFLLKIYFVQSCCFFFLHWFCFGWGNTFPVFLLKI